MSKPCPWCGAVVASDARICPTCRSAQPTTSPDPAPGQLVPPSLGYAPPPPGYGPPPPGYGSPPPGYGPPPGQPAQGSGTGRTAIIAIAVGVGALALVAIVCILAITFLGRSASSKFVAVEPIESSSSSGSGRDYPAQLRSNFLSSCSNYAPASACSCALEKIEQEYTIDEFIEAEQDYLRTGVLPSDMMAAMVNCVPGG